MTSLSGSSRLVGSPIQAMNQENAGSAPPLARLALRLLYVALVGCASCLPPEFEVAEDVNQPVTLDRSALAVPPGFEALLGCPPAAVEIDITSAISDADEDPLFILWFLNFEGLPGEGYVRIGNPSFEFNPCTTANVRVGGLNPNKVELLVFDRIPRSINPQDGEDTRVSDIPGATMVTEEWFFAVEDLTCCQGGGN